MNGILFTVIGVIVAIIAIIFVLMLGFCLVLIIGASAASKGALKKNAATAPPLKIEEAQNGDATANNEDSSSNQNINTEKTDA